MTSSDCSADGDAPSKVAFYSSSIKVGSFSETTILSGCFGIVVVGPAEVSFKNVTIKRILQNAISIRALATDVGTPITTKRISISGSYFGNNGLFSNMSIESINLVLWIV